MMKLNWIDEVVFDHIDDTSKTQLIATVRVAFNDHGVLKIIQHKENGTIAGAFFQPSPQGPARWLPMVRLDVLPEYLRRSSAYPGLPTVAFDGPGENQIVVRQSEETGKILSVHLLKGIALS